MRISRHYFVAQPGFGPGRTLLSNRFYLQHYVTITLLLVGCCLDCLFTILKFLQDAIYRNLYTIHLVNPISDKFQLRYLPFSLYTIRILTSRVCTATMSESLYWGLLFARCCPYTLLISALCQSIHRIFA